MGLNSSMEIYCASALEGGQKYTPLACPRLAALSKMLLLVMLIRWQPAFPAQPIPLVGTCLGETNAPAHVPLSEFHNR
jgi:hypothetical protein